MSTISVKTEAEYTQTLADLYWGGRERVIRFGILNVGVGGLQLEGGSYHVISFVTTASYGTQFAVSYRENGFKKRILSAGTWSSWSDV